MEEEDGCVQLRKVPIGQCVRATLPQRTAVHLSLELPCQPYRLDHPDLHHMWRLVPGA